MKTLSQTNLASVAERIATCGREIYTRGWSPSTSSNYSMRLDAESCAITISGCDKRRLAAADIMAVDLRGEPLSKGKPSAETLLHTSLYKMRPEIGAILHTHSMASAVLSLHSPGPVTLEGYELLKAFGNIDTHTTALQVPVFANTQAMNVLAHEVENYLEQNPLACYGYLIRGHGLYTWGCTLEEAWRHLEAFEFLFACELELLRLRQVPI